MVPHTCDPGTQEKNELETSLGYIERPELTKQTGETKPKTRPQMIAYLPLLDKLSLTHHLLSEFLPYVMAIIPESFVWFYRALHSSALTSVHAVLLPP